MDIGSIVGLVNAWALVLWSLVIGVGIGPYIDFPSFLIVIGGSVGIVMAANPINKLIAGLKSASKAFIYIPQSEQNLISQLVDFAVKARRDGILSLESEEENMKDEFLKKGIRLAVDGTEPEVIRTVLEMDFENMVKRHDNNIAVVGYFIDIAPAMGMIGTLIGLVAMLLNMSDPAAIGPAMAVALLTTFYGSLIANMIATPIATKMKIRSIEEQHLREIMLAGIMAIQSGDNPRIVEQKLNAYLPPSQRKSQFD